MHNAEMKFINICDAVDDIKPSWNTPLRNCITRSAQQTNSQKLPPGPERLSIYSDSLNRIGLSMQFYELKVHSFCFFPASVHYPRSYLL